MTRIKLALAAVVVAATVFTAACDATSVPTSVQQKDGSVWYEPAPVVTIPSEIAAECYVSGLDSYQCMQLAHYYGY